MDAAAVHPDSPPAPPAGKPRRLLLRGERGIAGLGFAAAVLLIVGVGVSVGQLDQSHQSAAAAEQTDGLKMTGTLLADVAARAIATGDVAGLRRTLTTLGTGPCTVSIGDNRVLADSAPGRANTTSLPPQWTLGSTEAAAGVSRFPFSVPGRGAGFVDLAPVPRAADLSRFAMPGAICAAALGVFVLVYRRTRRRLAELDMIGDSLGAMHHGESAVDALLVDERLGKTAVAWNKMLADFDALRLRARNAPAGGAGGRRAGGSNLESACDAMSQGIVLLDDKMRVRYANGAACAFLNLDRTQLASTDAAGLIADDKFRDAIAGIATGKQRRPTMIELEQPGGSGGVLRVGIRPVRRGDPDSAMVIIEDVTQQRTAEKARNQFINQVTHELRTPLTNIRLYAETAIEDGESNAEVRANCLNVINGESRRLERIVSEMLSVAEIEAGSMAVRRDEVYADVLIKELENDFAAQAKEKSIALEFKVSPKLPKLEADKDKLTLALHNLVGNALKYTPDGGRVTVNVDVADGQLVVDVADTGIGIAPAEQEKIFDRFFRSGDERVGKIIGTGLGLTLAREVMRLHGGDVTVRSELNRGSTFTATLPVAMAA